ncbi:LysM peptidoglycan-binding domain-containing protein [Haloplasma contractile]|uniref:Spore germination protein YaaH n=1 Tax=Haloplasma contractile SSD-17B TaxID=1033810 RepID=U2FH07_9MOLU|nr:LysM peptidoglycan-binding domain-containing protein [Haloplasma contractile]ERJ12140.1 Spore germination protein YaaH [Haloplasma contractile SSD-17B]
MSKTNNVRQECKKGSVPYLIRKGDTLKQIAKLYNSTVEAIIQVNQQIDPNKLMIGETICIPLSIQYYPTCPTTNYYIVREGDTLESISEYFNVTRQQLYYSNFGIDPDNLYQDQILCIPVSAPPVSITIDVLNRLLLVVNNNRVLRTYPISLSNPSMPISRGIFTILNKQVDPGVKLGARWIGLSEAGLGIRGTNTPQFIKTLTTDNSIVLSNKDASELFNLVPVGTIVTVR